MKSFRTEIEIRQSENKISHSNQVMLVGSCFTESIGEKLNDLLFYPDINPFGIIYNPGSVATSLSFLLEKKQFTKKDLFLHDEIYSSFYHHSRFSDPDPQKCLNNINSRIEFSSSFLQKSNFLFITFGTAWVYELIDNGKLVSNCHKLPAKSFSNRMMEVDEIVRIYKPLIEKIKILNPDIKIIFTISPVRHWKNGAENNMLSKSVINIAVHKLIEQFNHLSYFPSFEIMLDDLRDYRFYKDDMLHPNSLAISYIFEKFSETYFDETTRSINAEIMKLNDLTAHKSINPGSISHLDFVKKSISKIQLIQKKYPMVNFNKLFDNFRKNHSH
ncbi:MAG: GSCFA domain-containing protein [Bacteroidota bacterium]